MVAAVTAIMIYLPFVCFVSCYFLVHTVWIRGQWEINKVLSWKALTWHHFIHHLYCLSFAMSLYPLLRDKYFVMIWMWRLAMKKCEIVKNGWPLLGRWGMWSTKHFYFQIYSCVSCFCVQQLVMFKTSLAQIPSAAQKLWISLMGTMKVFFFFNPFWFIFNIFAHLTDVCNKFWFEELHRNRPWISGVVNAYTHKHTYSRTSL